MNWLNLFYALGEHIITHGRYSLKIIITRLLTLSREWLRILDFFFDPDPKSGPCTSFWSHALFAYLDSKWSKTALVFVGMFTKGIKCNISLQL